MNLGVVIIVEFEGVRFYVGERFIGAEVTLLVDGDRVQVFAGGNAGPRIRASQSTASVRCCRINERS